MDCPLCKVTFPSVYQREQHFNGKKHKKAVEATLNARVDLWCPTCNVSFPSEYQKTQHLNGKKHAAATKPKVNLMCELCEISCPSSYQYEQHLQGWKHQQKMCREEWVSVKEEAEFEVGDDL